MDFPIVFCYMFCYTGKHARRQAQMGFTEASIQVRVPRVRTDAFF